MSIDLMKHTPQASQNSALHDDDHLFGATTPRDCAEHEISAQDEALLALMKRLAIESPLSYETRHLPIARLIVPRDQLINPTATPSHPNSQLLHPFHPP